MVATRGRTFKRPWRRSYHSSKLKSSSAPTGRKDSWCFHAVGSSNAPLLGSTAAEGLPRIGRTSIATRWRSCGLPQSASCSENFVIPPDVFGQTLSIAHQHADLPNSLGLLRARSERPRRRRTAEQRDELASLHSITSSARASSVGGTSRPRALAALRLITNSYLLGACTGRSVGLSPFRTRST